jgi:hypothetical protein
MLQGVSYVQCSHEPVHKKYNARRYRHSLVRRFALSGRLHAAFHGVVNFAITEFSEVEHAFPAKTLMNSAVGQPLGEQFLRTLGPPASFIS